MSAPNPEIKAEPTQAKGWLQGIPKAIGLVLLVAVISAGTAFAVFQWQIRAEQQAVVSQVGQLRTDLAGRQDALEKKMDLVEKAATDARLLMSENGATTTLDSKLAEIDSLRTELKKTQDDMDTKLKNLEQSVADQVAKQGKETAQALAQELRWKNLLVKAQGEVLLSQVHWAESNRGMAKDELTTATHTLQQAMDEAPDGQKPAIKEALTLADQAKESLILEQSSARDSLNLLWHKVSELLNPGPKQ